MKVGHKALPGLLAWTTPSKQRNSPEQPSTNNQLLTTLTHTFYNSNCYSNSITSGRLTLRKRWTLHTKTDLSKEYLTAVGRTPLRKHCQLGPVLVARLSNLGTI